MTQRVTFRLVRKPNRTPYQQWRFIYNELEQEMFLYMTRLKNIYFVEITRGWKNAFVWRVRTRRQVGRRRLWTDIRIGNRRAKTRDRPRSSHRATLVQLWYWIWLGTKRHPITPQGLRIPSGSNISIGKRARGGADRLWFRAGPYIPKTIPGPARYGGPGSRSGPLIPSYGTVHPGFRGRDWIDVANKFVRKTLKNNVDRAMRRGFRGMTR